MVIAGPIHIRPCQIITVGRMKKSYFFNIRYQLKNLQKKSIKNILRVDSDKREMSRPTNVKYMSLVVVKYPCLPRTALQHLYRHWTGRTHRPEPASRSFPFVDLHPSIHHPSSRADANCEIADLPSSAFVSSLDKPTSSRRRPPSIHRSGGRKTQPPPPRNRQLRHTTFLSPPPPPPPQKSLAACAPSSSPRPPHLDFSGGTEPRRRARFRHLLLFVPLLEIRTSATE